MFGFLFRSSVTNHTNAVKNQQKLRREAIKKAYDKKKKKKKEKTTIHVRVHLIIKNNQ